MQGQKLQLKTHAMIDNQMKGGAIKITYKMLNFGKDEQLRIGLNG